MFKIIKEKTVLFIGHRDIITTDTLKNEIKKEIEKLILSGYDTFLNGGLGDFDFLCASCVKEFKNIYPHIKCVLILYTISYKGFWQSLYDDCIFPEVLDKCFIKYAIIKRNEWMIKNSSSAICYVKYPWGGAFNTYEKAKKNNLNIIDIK